MKEDESIKIAKAARALGVILDMDQSGSCAEVNLAPNTRAHVEMANMALQELLTGPIEKAEKRLNLAEGHLELAQQKYFEDGELFGADGEPTEAAENGVRLPIDRGFDEPELFGNNGEVAQAIDWRVPGTSSVRADLHRGLIEALRNGDGKRNACEKVAHAAGVDVNVTKDAFETLVKLGVIARNGKGWVADAMEDHAANLSSGPDGVCATSETPEGSEPVAF